MVRLIRPAPLGAPDSTDDEKSSTVTSRPGSTPTDRNRSTSAASASKGPSATRGRIDANCSSGAR